MTSTVFTDNTGTATGTTIVAAWLNDVNTLTYGAPLSGGSALIGFLQAGTGAALRTVQAKLRDEVSVKDFGAVGDGVTNDTTAVQAALDYATQNNLKLTFPKGIYLVSTGLTINGISASNYGKMVHLEGVGGQVDGTPGATIIKWNGTSSSSNTLLKVNGAAKLVCTGIAFYGSGNVGKVVWATQNVGTSYSPFGWRFTDCTFESALSGGYGFYIDTSTNIARFTFTSCYFQAGTGNTGFYSSNQNSVSHSFVGCTFSSNNYGINLNGGSFNAFGCEFTLNALADVYFQIHSPCSLYGCWSEQSRRFILSDFRTQYSPLTLVGCTTSSFPWSYWKLGPEGSRTQPTNDSTQWSAVVWDGPRGALNLVGCNFTDPFNGAVTGVVAPTTASTLLADCTNGTSTFPPVFNFIGSFSQNGVNSFTEQFMGNALNNLGAPRFPTRRQYTAAGNLSGAFTVQPKYYSNVSFTLTGNGTATIDTTSSSAGDHITLDVTQDGSGGRTLALVNTKTAGTFTPSAAAGARSRIEFEFDGTNWIEVSRSLSLV